MPSLYSNHPIDSQTLWIERTSMETAAPLPGILRWFEVTRRRVEEIPPVRFACETMERTTAELRQLISQHGAEPKRNINPLSMRLQVSTRAQRSSREGSWGIQSSDDDLVHPEFVAIV